MTRMTPYAIRCTFTLVALIVLAGAWPAESGRTAHRRVLSRVAAGSAHSCAVADDRTVRCWGWNDFGQVGNAGNLAEVATSVSGLFTSQNRPPDVLTVVAGAIHTCAVRVDTIACWGANESGQIGDNTTIDRFGAVHLAIVGAIDVALGISHTCALLQNGSVRCWGDNTFGQLGTGNRNPQIRATTATNVSGLTDAVALGAGLFHTCAVRVNGQVVCWGYNGSGQLGNNAKEPPCDPSVAPCGQTTPSTVLNMSQAVDVVAGETHTCALRANGRVRCWGNNESGQLGDGTFAESLDATEVEDLENVKVISAGWHHSCALTASGNTLCWGANFNGQLGNDSRDASGVPVFVLDLPIDAVDLASGNTHSCVLRAMGSLSCWGSNEFGELGSPPVGPPSEDPRTVLNISGNIPALSIDAQGNHTCAVRGTSAVVCWGSNSDGQLTGIASTTPQRNPVAPFPAVTNVIAAAAGSNHTCVLFANGTVSCWGRMGGTVSAPTPVAGLDNVVAIAGGGDFRCALRADGTVRCWGEGSAGQLGNGTADSLAPVEVNSLSTVVAISVGSAHACAIRANGTVRCWGSNGSRQLGNENTTAVAVPDHVAVSGLSNARAVAAGGLHTCAIRATGRVVCWGANGLGQLGTGNTTASPTFVPVVNQLRTNPTTVTQTTIVANDIAAGSGHTCITGGSLRTICWGANSELQVGMANVAGSPLRHEIPALVVGQEPAARGRTMIAVGGNHSCALMPNGVPVCWGDAQFGQNSGTQDSSTPLFVSSFLVNIAPAATLAGRGGTAKLIVVANCLPGQHFTMDVQVQQGNIVGTGHGAGRCEGTLLEYPVTVAAQGRNGFAAGAAVGAATIVIRENGKIVETHDWTRQITIAP
jgi:alpha-tubulin suppressor-like RCC1 family protein